MFGLKKYVFFILFFIVSLSLTHASHAQTPEEAAQKVLEASVTRILDFIKAPGYGDPTTRQSLNSSIEKEVYQTFDFNEFAMRTAGTHWRSFNTEQKEAFSTAFAALLFATYLDRIDGYNGERIAYTGVVSNKAKTRIEVRTVLTLKDGAKVSMAYRMLPKSGTWRIYDVLIENVSLVQNYRTQFGDILSKENPEELTARVYERAAAVRKSSHEKK